MNRFSFPAIIAGLGAALLFVSCTAIIPSGVTVTKEFSLTGFDTISASSALVCTVKQGAAFKVTVSADQNAAPYVDVNLSGTTLNLGMKPGVAFMGSVAETQVTIELPSLVSVSSADASVVTVTGFTATSPALTLKAGNASTLDWTGGPVGSLTLGADNSAIIRYSGQAVTSLAVTAANASSVHVDEGQIDAATIKLNGASRFKAAAALTSIKTAQVTLAEASTAEFDCSGSISGTLTGASNLRYGLTPTTSGLTSTDASHFGAR